MKAPFHATEETRAAIGMLSQGATRGMVKTALAKDGMRDHTIDEVIEAAARIVNRRKRFRFSLIGVFGLMVVVAGAVIMLVCFNRGIRIVRVPGAIMLTGMMIAMYGFYNLRSDTI